MLVGGRRLLDYFPDHPVAENPPGQGPGRHPGPTPGPGRSQRVVVLASGDPNFYGIGPLVVKVLGADRVVIHPNVTAVQAACARLKLPWQDATVISLHGRTWAHLAAALNRAAEKLVIYTDPEHTPAAIARFLLDQGRVRGPALRPGRPGPEDGAPHLAQPGRGPGPGIFALESGGDPDRQPGEAPPGPASCHLGLPEAALAHQAGLITKAEVRAVALAKLELFPGLTLWDVGAGCGSVGLEASLLLPGGQIFAVEQDPERADQIRANAGKSSGCTNLKVVCGHAPGCLAELPDPQRVFLGGGGRDLPEILQEAMRRLAPEGRLVLTATLLETLETARDGLGPAGWEVEVTQLQVSRSRPLAGGDLQALNPVWIVTGI